MEHLRNTAVRARQAVSGGGRPRVPGRIGITLLPAILAQQQQEHLDHGPV